MASKKRILWIIGSALIAAVLCVGAVLGFGLLREQRLEKIQAAALAELDADAGSYDETSIVLSNTSKAEAEKLAEKFGAELRITESGKFAQLTLPEGVTIRDIYAADENRQYIKEMAADYSVSIAHGSHQDHGKRERHDRHPSRPKYRYTISDRDYGLQDHFDYINMEDVWDKTTGSGITVAVIDTGIDTDHPEFSGRISEYSYNVSEDKIVKDYLLEDGSYDWSLIEDEQGHGTTVAGVIASSMNSGSVVGVSPNVELLVIKAECDERGVYRRGSDLAFAIYYAIEQNANVVNMSFAGEGDYYKAALQLAYDSDVICVAAAGNEETASPYYPAADANAIGVGALAADGWELADYSNYGENTNIVAPGSTYTTLKGGQYGLVSGTSYSAPVVTGAIALLLQTDKYMTFDEVTELLYASAYDIGDLGPDSTFGFGALDVDALVQGERGTVTFDMLTEELENTEQIFIREHTLLDIPEPERLYAVFDGWYYDDTFTEEFNYYEDTFTSDLTLYAHWVNEDDGIPFTYVTLDDGTVEIRSYTGHRRYITIPDVIDGKAVSSIGEGAFSGESRLREVELPSGLTTIREYAFSGCSNLLRVEIPAKVDHIHQYAFAGCSRLSAVTYAGKSTLGIIENYAFKGCSSLEQFTIPASVYHVDGLSFFGTTSMRRYIVERGNNSYIAKDGVLFTKTMNKLLAYPAAHGNTYSLPENVKVIGAGGFAFSKLTQIDLGAVTELGACAFAYANLYEITVPDSVVLLGDAVFANTYLSRATLGAGITELPKQAFAGNFFLSEIEIPQNVTKIGEGAFSKSGIYAPGGLSLTFAEGSRLVTIEPFAFMESAVSRLDFPASLVQIGRNAFKDCLALQSVTFPADSDLKSISDRAFWRCGNLAAINLPEGLEFIGELAFYYNFSLSEITVPASVTELGAGAFASCQSLEAIEVAEGNKNYHDVDGVVYSPDNTKVYAYPSGNPATSYDLPGTVVRVENYAFANSFYLKTVNLPEGLQEIGEYGFHGCISLTSLKIPDSVTQISRYAFAQSWSLTNITLNETSQLPRIGYAAFSYCAVRQLTIPAKVSTIAQGAFEGCSLLQSITFAENSTLESISAYMFNGCSNLQSITFKSGSALKQVQAHGLEGMSKLTSIDFSNTKLTEIDNFSFRFCESLSKVTLPEGTLNIGRYAFYGCEALAELNIPASVEHIGSYAFLAAGDTSLYFAAEILPLYLDENWDYGVKGYYLGVTKVITEGDFKYAITTTGNIAILDYTGSAETLDLAAYDFGGEITIIGGSAFEESALTAITLPETLNTIQAEAFAYSKLAAVRLPAAVKFIGRNAFAGTPVETVEIAEGSQLAVIEQYAFEKTEKLASIALPASLTTMGTGVFSQSGLAEVTFAEGIALAEIPQKAFAETKLAAVALPDSVTLVNHSAFNNVQTLQSVSFGENDGIRLMSNAFYHTGLTELHIPANVTYIGEYCFVALPNLQAFTVDENNELYKAEDGLLLNKSGRKLIAAPAGRTGELTLPLSIEEIGFGAFEETALSAVNFQKDANILSLGYRAFFKADNLTEITVPASVVSIDYYAFAYCKKLTTVNFADGIQLKGIYEGAFCGDINLENITIPDSIVEISDFAFYGCSKIDEIPVSETTKLTSISDYAFAYTNIGGEYTFSGQLVDIGPYSFAGCDFTKIIVPDDNKKQLFIGIGAFEDCNKLEEITLPFIGQSYEDEELSWFGYIFGAGTYKANDTYVPDSLKKVTLSEGITFVGVGGFYGITTIEEVDVPHSVQVLYTDAFSSCEAAYQLIENIKFSDSSDLGKSLSGHINISVDMDIDFSGFVNLESVTIEDGVTNIPDYAFDGCSSLKKIDIPDSVISIGKSAFRECKSLESIVIPDSVTSLGSSVFSQCTDLKQVVLSDRLTEIPFNAFAWCSSLTSIILPEGLMSIGMVAFDRCGLESLTIPSTVTQIGLSAFQYCSKLYEVINNSSLNIIAGDSANGQVSCYAKVVVDKNGIKHGSSDFEYVYTEDGFKFAKNGSSYTLVSYTGNDDTITLPHDINGKSYGINKFTGAKHIIIPEGWTTVSGFNDCTTIETIVVPEGVTEIGYEAFSGCTNLKEIILPNSIKCIAASSFEDCSSIKNIILPDSVTAISSRAFFRCSSLESIKLSNRLLSIGGSCFAYTNLNNIVIPDSVEEVYGGAFEGCETLESVTMGSGVKYIAPTAFKNDDAISKFVINSNNFKIKDNIVYDSDFEKIEFALPNISGDIVLLSQVVSINDYAFSYCGNINSVVIPEGVTTIGDSAFSRCSLKSVTLPTTLTNIGASAFFGSSLRSIEIPEGISVIGEEVFSNCNSLENVTLPSTLLSIEDKAFASCSSLAEITNNSSLSLSFGSSEHGRVALNAKMITDKDGNVSYLEGTDYKHIYTDDGFKFRLYDGEYALLSYHGDEECPVLPVDINGNSYTAYNANIKKITIPPEWTEVNVGVFADRPSLRGNPYIEEIVIPEGVISIGEYAFIDCRALKKVSLPETLERIDRFAFENCISLEVVNIPNSVKNIGAGIVDNTAIYSDPQRWDNGSLIIDGWLIRCNKNIKYIANWNGVKGAAQYVYDGCYSLKNAVWDSSYSLPTNIETLIVSKSQRNMKIPDSLTLKYIVIPENFDVNLLSTCPELFKNLSGVTIYVESLESDLRWDDNFPGWNNGNRVVYGDKWNWVKFYDDEGTLIYCEPHKNSEIIRQPAVISDNPYLEVIGWDTNGDGELDIIPATTATSITATTILKCSHNVIVDAAVSATCTTSGLTEGKHCDVCGEVFVAQQTVPALGHDEEPHAAKPQSCTAIGWNEYVTCSRCDYTTYEELPALGHDEVPHDGKEAACGVIGWDPYVTCTRCDYTTYEEKKALDHQLTQHDGKKATCTEGGWEPYETCSECDYTSYKEIGKLGHETVYQDAVEPKCTETGLTAGSYCDRCKEVFVAQTEVDALGHDWGDWQETKAPSADEDGNEHRECGRCDAFEDRVLKDVVTVESGNVRAGEDLTVTLSLAEGHDIAEAIFAVEYDAALLEVKSVESSELFTSCEKTDDAENGILKIEVAGNGTGAGTALTVVFTAKANTKGSYAVQVSAEKILNQSGAEITFKQAQSAAKVVEYKKGDLTVDGEVNMFDAVAMLRRLAAGDTMENESVAELDGASGVTSLDIVYLLQSLIGMRTL